MWFSISNSSHNRSLVISLSFSLLSSSSSSESDKTLANILNIFRLFVMPGYSYRLRLINAIAIECPLVVHASKHLMTVIVADAKPVQPVTSSTVKLYPGTIIIIKVKIKINQLHTISRTQQGRQREPSVKTLRSPLSAEFWRHCVLSGRPQRHA